MIDLGDTVTLAATVQDASGANVNAATVAVTVTLPDGTSVPLEPSNPPATTGQYQIDYVPVQSGLHAVRWVTTGPARGHTDEFYVQGSAPTLIVSSDEVKKHLQITRTADDDKLRLYIDAASRKIETDPDCGVGPVVRRTYTQIMYPAAAGSPLALERSNVLSLTSGVVVRDGSTVDLTHLVADNGVLRPQYGYGGVLPIEPWTLTYVAGMLTVPGNVRLAVLELVRHLWDSSQRGTQNVRAGDDDPGNNITGLGFAIPYAVQGLLAGDDDLGGWA